MDMPGMDQKAPDQQPAQAQPQEQRNMPGMDMSGKNQKPADQPQSKPSDPPTPPSGPLLPAVASGAGMTLEELQQMAVAGNPTLRQAEAEIRAAEGRKRQAGFYPNPTVGYLGEEIRGGSFRGGEQGGFIRQDIVLGGKLGAAKNVFEQERLQANAEREEQLLRVNNAVALGYYRSLAAQQMVQLRMQLAKVAEDAVVTSKQLFNVGQADNPDVLQAEIEVEQAQLALITAQHNQQRMWTALTAVIGKPELPLTPLAGDLENVPDLDTQQWMQSILQDSPAVKIARLEASRAEAELRRNRKQPIPDLQLRGGLQQNRELNETTGRPVGLQGFAEVGVQIPLWNRNQGNIQVAKAAVERANLEGRRIDLLLRERSASLVRSYQSSKVAVDRYRNQMIPRAEKAYRQYLARYNTMAAAYPQVIIAQRTLFQLQTDYLSALENLWMSTVSLRGFMLTDGLEAPTAPSEMDRPVRETNVPSASATTTER